MLGFTIIFRVQMMKSGTEVDICTVGQRLSGTDANFE